jgi:hypothetical protein
MSKKFQTVGSLPLRFPAVPRDIEFGVNRPADIDRMDREPKNTGRFNPLREHRSIGELFDSMKGGNQSNFRGTADFLIPRLPSSVGN